MAAAVLSACPFSTPPGFHFNTHPEGEPCIYLVYIDYINVFFHPSAFFSLTAAGLFPCSQLCGAQGVCPDTTVHVWALAEVRGTYSGGSEWQIPTGSDSEHVEPSRPMQTHVQVRRMSDSPCDIWDLECCQCRQTLLLSLIHI